jgi:sorting nexin-29
MEDLGIPQKVIKITKTTMKYSVTQIRIQSSLSEPLKVNNELGQGDPLACLLFNIALERAVREANIQITGHTFHKSAQILAYADEVDIEARTKAALIEAFSALEKSAKKMGLKINQEKTKFMIVIPPKKRRENTSSHASEGWRIPVRTSRVFHIPWNKSKNPEHH